MNQLMLNFTICSCPHNAAVQNSGSEDCKESEGQFLEARSDEGVRNRRTKQS